MHRTRIRSAITGLLVLAAAILASPAQAAPSATAGLYGPADPTYDGAFRQSLAILGLLAVGERPAPQAVTWLLDQQCADGSWQAYRSDLSIPCTKSDPENFTGSDTNSTALAITALMALDRKDAASSAQLTRIADAADRGMTWLLRAQAPDGGWPWFLGAATDASSTGLALMAARTQAPNDSAPALVKARRYLDSLVLPCAGANGGSLPNKAGGPADSFSTAQGYVGLTTVPPVYGPRKLKPAPKCAGPAADRVGSYIARTLAASGALPNSFGSGIDLTSTAASVIGLVAAGVGKAAVAKATSTLATNARTMIYPNSGLSAGALGLLLMVAETTGRDPRSFGGINLVTTLQRSMR